MKKLRIFALMAVMLSVFMTGGASWADKIAPNETYIEFSKNGKYYIVMAPSVPYGDKGAGLAFKVRKGADKLLWQVDWYARRVYISNDGTKLVREGPWAKDWKNLSDLAMAFYDKGGLLKKYLVSGLIGDKKNIRRTASHYFWREKNKGMPYGFSKHEKYFRLTTTEGIIFTFAVTSGYIIEPEDDG